MEVLVVGAGVIGLATARAAAARGHDVVIAERTAAIGTGISSRNSEVIHGGMYYPTGSVRARHCVAGRRMLYAFCERHGVAHRKCGKLIVATTDAERARIDAILALGRANGVDGLRLLERNEVATLEPALRCVGALQSSETGIIDGHAYMLALHGALEAEGGAIAFGTPVERVERHAGRWRVTFGGSDAGAMDFDAVVNCAGLGAQTVARACVDYPPDRIPPLVLCKGNYFSYASRPAFRHLIYPVPVDGGLGVHVTLDLAGRMRFGPDVEWIETENYDVDAARAQSFYARIRSYWPALPDDTLSADYCGIRPKLTGPGEPAADFVIDGPDSHGLPGLIHFFGIESPGLTASLSLADAAVALLDERSPAT
jgi:L-2-hydroxyglutarate oxidase LhgO